jgi:hypothetical protein
VFQNIFVISRARSGQWQGSFTQEWPLPSVRHQVSFTLPFSFGGPGTLGDVGLNYRFQLTEEGAGRLPGRCLRACAPDGTGARSNGCRALPCL